ncbi:hypothetical protein F8S09_14855 [Deinococcus sp. SDU3-2]|uniref:HTTM-like domain-containing protein n=1 Tax=Deinococcus terrestris TaxID=2651870 RepID=A0A7X1NYP0_9DEIO|nr:hypothetical protein [Deinococcus terrestris]MPY67939.1 hypothetical protein [Deinococcus terrestris]
MKTLSHDNTQAARRPTLVRQLESKLFNTVGVRLLQIFVGSAIAYRCLTELAYVPYFYGQAGPMMSGTGSLLGPHLGAAVDQLVYSPLGIYLFFGLWLAGGLGLVLGYKPRLATLLALVGYLWAEARSITHDGGDNVLRIVLLYMLLLRTSPGRAGPGRFFHNLAVIGIYVQLCLLYFVAGTLKLDGDVWKNGTALYYVTQVNWFTPPWPWMQELFKNPWVVTAATYSAVIYQVGFPFMLFNRFHLVWVPIGLAFHLGIGVAMGLVSFSLAMMGLVLFTVRDSEWAALAGWVERALQSKHLRRLRWNSALLRGVQRFSASAVRPLTTADGSTREVSS